MTKQTENVRTARVLEVFRALCIGVDSPRSLKAALLAKYQEFEQLARMKIHPTEYCNPDEFLGDWTVVSFLKKNKDLPKVTDTRAAAVRAFKSSEEACRMTNDVLEAWTEGRFCLPSSVVEVIHLAQRKISKLLDGVEPFDVSKYSWGPGATYDLKRSCAYPDTKIIKLPFSVTASALPRAASLINRDLHWKRAIIEANPGYQGPIFKIVQGGRYDTVAKTVLTDRSIMVEPRLNALLQKQLGAQLRARLKRVGVDLDDQSHNQALAAFAYRCGYATLDLEAASDTVSTKLVEILLPPDWYDAMDAVRSKLVRIDGSWHKLEKFSSMGNGFTFELESLIFWALSSACCELTKTSTLGVYGDDIIVHRRCANRVIEALGGCGFKLNAEKSFISGMFFESCGSHYFGDVDVTPIYQKESPDELIKAIRMGNRILRVAYRSGGPNYLDERFRAAYECTRRVYEIPSDRYGPFIGEGDGYLEAPASDISGSTRAGVFGTTRVKVKTFVVEAKEIPAFEAAMLALSLAEIGEEGGVQAHRPSSTREALLNWATRLEATSGRIKDGNVASRVSMRVKTTHRWVDMTQASMSLGW